MLDTDIQFAYTEVAAHAFPIAIVLIESNVDLLQESFVNLALVGESEGTWYYVGASVEVTFFWEYWRATGGRTKLNEIVYSLVAPPDQLLRRLAAVSEQVALLVRRKNIDTLLDFTTRTMYGM